MDTFSAAGKLVVGSLWVWGLLALGSPEVPYAPVALSILKALTMVHIVESLLFIPAIRGLGKPLFPNVPLVFVFGVFHLWSMRAEADLAAPVEEGDKTDGDES
jgi:uncharacterized protein YhhL (DUF1145 family)